MSSTNLMHWGGLAAILAGVLRGIASFVPSSPSVALELLYFATDVCILFGIMGLYGFQHEETRLWGFFGFLLATIGIGLIIGPDGEISGVNMYTVGTLIFAAGISLLAIGSWIANRLPRWAPACWIISTVLGFIGYFVKGLDLLFVISGVIFGIGFAGAGIKVWSATSNQHE